MASQSVMFSVQTPLEIKNKKPGGQQERKQLEREVSMLQKMLNQEEKMHEILDHAHNQHNGSAISIPNFLPPKMKELLAELAMVEDEIARLEGQISQLQSSLEHEQEIIKDSQSKVQWQRGSLSHPRHHPSLTTKPNSIYKGGNEIMAYETKALHFISKAIKGDYGLNDFTVSEKLGNRFDDQKENPYQEAAKFQDKVVPRKSGMLKPSSPLRDPRHPSPKPRERNSPIFSDIHPKSLPTEIQLEEENQQPNLQPNLLSESIMKCLNLIYTRLLRISRAIELEKSGPISRSMNTSFSSRSFRADTGLKSSLLLQKESRQQDPYGIFDMEESIPRDIGPYKNLVIFTSNSLDPKSISSSSSIPLLRKLSILLNSLQTVDLRILTNQQKLAFWINMYNACIMHGFIQYGAPSTPQKLLAIMNKATLNIGGNIINAHAIEHFILRKPASSSMKEVYRKGEKDDDKEGIVRELFGIESMDPNVIFALCCGTRSSPALPTSGSLRKSMVDCFRGHSCGRISSIVEKIPCDLEFQYLLAI
ncbi:hypothetical protein I3843_14G087000 [Carya illinoinensis]|uniref:uncharacterized protein LOC122293418 isoform X3 n=1 Tax=Carya illinoinensis TaxID=32201 RepID=UPI001BF9DB95|nr:uncharacterized protein LOC122293418 isoform X3 [Carya illinoinensis]KAG2670485.1 hypothetical protein I3760_14G087400 [Carya illinoinensis]KAG7947307.1 hypothetical protein I3843_14G087000 [Carya illinoinensis]